ncbi:MAG: ankyrin repeat domain-containing protein, partial [Desulfobacteraceae bacterium]|nr:ankyrin repeat domain-containing protein [Desulfobacteraceae bacterium]
MALESTKSSSRTLNEYNVYQNGLNNNDNSKNQAKRLQSLTQKNFPKANARNNNQNSYKAKTSVSKIEKLKQVIRKNFCSQNGKNKHLFEAAKRGNAKLVKKWINAGADMNMADSSGRTLLFWAARNGHADVVKELLSRPEIDVNRADHDGWTPLFLA